MEIFVLADQDDSAADWVAKDHPKARQKIIDGWTCAEGAIETKKVATCGRDPGEDLHFIRARLIAPPKQYKGLGGVKPDTEGPAKVEEAMATVCIDTAGKVSRSEVLVPTTYGSLDEMILPAVAKWSFSPYREDGVAIRACAAFTITFRRQD
jgi:TonB family protein